MKQVFMANDQLVLSINSPEEVALKLMEKILIKEPVANNSEHEIIELYKRCLTAVKYPERESNAFRSARNAEMAINGSFQDSNITNPDERMLNTSVFKNTSAA
jgi:hypothetical protein